MKLIWATLMIAIIVNLVGCATASQTFDQSGEAVYDIACSGLAVPMSACYEKALQTCPKGYYLVSRDTGSGSIGTMNSSGGTTTGAYAQGINKGLIIKCK